MRIVDNWMTTYWLQMQWVTATTKKQKKIDVSVPILFQSHSNQKPQFVLDYENLLLIKKKKRKADI